MMLRCGKEEERRNFLRLWAQVILLLLISFLKYPDTVNNICKIF